ncbi:glucose 1-dehydrogenase [Litchfieldia alkalitelluris]|uniref:glucose 1-dehydrogenase n=1 Tax=Litchfieldia alkalitelluris TaxID=304268 RepID=UPI000998B638|nr:glucose 1-dehydrogenase [Litchfieldia alkalitelluris]
MSFSNKVVVVTGAGHGIGAAIAKAYANNGATVVIADIDSTRGENIASIINDHTSGTALFVKTDVKEQNDIKRLVEKTIHNFGEINILINNAGTSNFKSFYDVTLKEWDEVINTNLRSVFLCSQEASRYMRKNKLGGAIINIASTRAYMSEANTESYSASKGGIVALTHSLAITLGDDKITVNSISPGWIEVNDYEGLREIDHTQHPAGRVGTVEDIARACLYLTGEQNNFITGTDLVIDGGMTKKMIYEH